MLSHFQLMSHILLLSVYTQYIIDLKLYQIETDVTLRQICSLNLSQSTVFLIQKRLTVHTANRVTKNQGFPHSNICIH